MLKWLWRLLLCGLLMVVVLVVVFLVVYFKPAHDQLSAGLPGENYLSGYGTIYYAPSGAYNPEVDETKAKVSKMTAATTKGKDGEAQKRIAISPDQWPGLTKVVLLGTEDREFYNHIGVNPVRMVKAAYVDIIAWRLKEGASTITQQICKAKWLTMDKTWDRKFKEWGFALALESSVSKDEIFAMYCNGVNMGQAIGGFAIIGFGEAAEYYFGENISQYKDVNPKNVAHVAMLVAVLKGTTIYSPYRHPDDCMKRRNLVIDSAVGFEFTDANGKTTVVTREIAEQAKKLPLGVKNQQASAETDGGTQYAIGPVENQLARILPNANSARINVYSTIIQQVQNAAKSAISENMPEVEKALKAHGINPEGVQVALVAMESASGAVVASVGGRNFVDSQFDRVNKGEMTPGSAFKPLVYWNAFDLEGSQYTPLTQFPDEVLPDYFGPGKPGPNNFGGKPSGKPMTLRFGLTKSENTIAVRLIKEVTPKSVSNFAASLGLPRSASEGLSLALGTSTANPFQMAKAYIPLSRGDGQLVEPSYIRRVTSEDGRTLYRLEPKPRQVSSPESAFLTTNILRDVLDKGTGSQVRVRGFKGLAAGKTGTSRDAWFVGYTPRLVCAVWVGFDEKVTLDLTGGSTAAVIWAEFMKKLQTITPEYFAGQWEKPKGIVQAQYQVADGKLGNEYFLSSYKGLVKVPYLQPDGTTDYKYFVKGAEPALAASSPGVLPSPAIPEQPGLASSPGQTVGPTPRPTPVPFYPDDDEKPKIRKRTVGGNEEDRRNDLSNRTVVVRPPN